jgi:hydrogenase maturation protein HypF
MRARIQIRITGQVQGVGFRPHVYRLAHELGLSGRVANTGGAVTIEAEGAATEELVARLRASAPAGARLDSLEVRTLPLCGDTSFAIVDSSRGAASGNVGPDRAVCADCLRDLFDPADRRYLYPFLNCTACGPRFSIVDAMPYDRERTSMKPFAMCAACARDYGDPGSRMFHAQPVACATCGPRLSHSPAQIAARLLAGELIAIRGIGGFHLVCDGRNERAVLRLRSLKRRDRRPFAVMALNAESVRCFARVSAAEQRCLEDPARPIVLLESREGGLARAVSCELSTTGAMLPHTPLHYLLFYAAIGAPPGAAWLAEPCAPVWVMTSANAEGEPLAAHVSELVELIEPCAPAELDCVEPRVPLQVVSHDRDIIQRCDDSVVRVVQGVPLMIRRARGYVPRPLELARPLPTVLAVGAELKNTICLIRGDQAFVSEHLGDLQSAGARRRFRDTVQRWLELFGVTPERVAHDLHPDFYATRFARSLGVPCVAVQHHHAHVASVVAEARLAGPVLGLALDGYGLGHRGEAWGGELLRVEDARCERVGYLRPIAAPGAERAAREPWRMAASVLCELGQLDQIPRRFAAQPHARPLATVLGNAQAFPRTSSCGRLFDAAAALLLGIECASFEGEAAMRLEGAVTRTELLPGGWTIRDGVLDLLPLFEALTHERDPARGANLFHGTLIAGLIAWVAEAAATAAVDRIVLSGGCMLNRVLVEGLLTGLRANGLSPVVARELPPGDGGLSLGQAWIAATSSG